MPMVRSVQTVQLSCTDANTISKQIETRFYMTHAPRSSIGCLQYYFQANGTFDANRAPILHQELHYLQTDRTELALEPHHLGVPSSASKMISMPMVCSVETVLLSCTDTNTVSKWTKTRFHTPLVTYEFHRVCNTPGVWLP
jgi:hypothetical protein